MSSRILDGDKASVQAFSWRTDTSSPMPPAVSRSSQAEPISSELDQKARAAELESVGARRFAEGREQGKREGLAEGEQRAAAQLAPLIQRLSRSIAEVSQTGTSIRREAEAEVVRLSLAIARRILHRELSMDPAALIGIAKAALDTVDARELQKIRVHPEDVALLSEELKRSAMPKRVEVIGDATLERGAVIFETTRGELDASVGTQLSEIERGLADFIGRRR